MARTLNLFEAATGKGRVIRQGDIVQVVMDGSGAFVCAAAEFLMAQKWAQSKMGSTNTITDRGRFIEKIEVLIARPNSFVATRGSTNLVERVAKAMKQGGYDMNEWTLPPEVKEALKPKFDKPRPKEAATEVVEDEPPAAL